MDILGRPIVLLQQLPGGAAAQRWTAHGLDICRLGGALALTGHGCHVDQLALRMTALFDLTQSIRSSQDLTNDTAPSSCSSLASAPTSMPALPHALNTFSQSPPSGGSAPPTSPCSAKALRVPSGMVLIVNGAASALTSRMSDAFGSLVPVLAHK